jgi:sec-independent protein translocase protein TatA
MFGLGLGELLLALALLVVFFGAKRIPDIARGMGLGIRGFKEGIKDPDQISDGDDDDSD